MGWFLSPTVNKKTRDCFLSRFLKNLIVVGQISKNKSEILKIRGFEDKNLRTAQWHMSFKVNLHSGHSKL